MQIWADKNGKVLVMPPSKLRDGDADFIRAHKAELLDALGCKPCPGVCPGPTHELCAGCPSPTIEIMYGDGLIAPQWCADKPDACATHWRERGGDWNEISKAS